jgi:hypothetical protein
MRLEARLLLRRDLPEKLLKKAVTFPSLIPTAVARWLPFLVSLGSSPPGHLGSKAPAPTMARHGSLWPHRYSMRARRGMSPTVAGNDGDDGCAAVVDEELGTARWSLSAEASPGVRLIFAPIRSVPSTRSCP